MDIFLKGDIHGRYCFGSPSVRGHYRPIDNDTGISYVLRSGVLYDVGRGLGSSRYLSDIRGFQLFSSKHKGKDFK